MNIVLHYFEARGRAQFMRYFLSAREIPYEDHRIPLGGDFSAWLSIKDDRQLTGPFKRLPVIEIDGLQIPETLVIADYLHRRFGGADALDETTQLRHGTLLSSVYGDMMVARGALLWVDNSHPGVDLKEHLRFMLRRFGGYLDCLEAAVREWDWLERPSRQAPLVADCLLWEELDALDTVFGPAFGLGDYPALAAFHAGCPGKETFERVRDANPCQFTGRPGEADMIARLHAIMTELNQEQSK